MSTPQSPEGTPAPPMEESISTLSLRLVEVSTLLNGDPSSDQVAQARSILEELRPAVLKAIRAAGPHSHQDSKSLHVRHCNLMDKTDILLGEVIPAGEIPLYWKIDLADMSALLEQLAGHLGDEVRQRFMKPFGALETHPHVTLLYIGGKDVETAAQLNSITVEKLEQSHQALCRMAGRTVDFRITGWTAKDGDDCHSPLCDMLVVQVEVPDAVACSSDPPSMTLAGTNRGNATRVFFEQQHAAQRVHPIDPPLKVQGDIMLCTDAPRDQAKALSCLHWLDDIFLEDRNFKSLEHGCVRVMLPWNAKSGGSYAVQISKPCASRAIRDRIVSVGTSRWPATELAIRPLTIKSSSGDRILSESSILIRFTGHDRVALEFHKWWCEVGEPFEISEKGFGKGFWRNIDSFSPSGGKGFGKGFWGVHASSLSSSGRLDVLARSVALLVEAFEVDITKRALHFVMCASRRLDQPWCSSMWRLVARFVGLLPK